ncbi:MAG: MFS transporter [Anaerolineales bacterium]|nr:MFS transporter [Anaerolineales bacterium]
MQKRASAFELVSLNTYWVGLSFMWNSLHVLILPAVLLGFVEDARKNTVLGLLTFTGLIVAMVVQPISGALSDRWYLPFGRRRPWIAVGTLMDLLFLAVLTFAGGLPLLALGYIGLQFTSNIAHGPAQGLMHDRVPLEQMGMASGIKNLFDMAGLVVSSLLVGRILTERNVPLALGAVAVFLVLSSLVTLFGVRENTHLPDDADDGAKPFDFIIGSLRGQRVYQRLILSRLFFLTGVYGVQTFAQYYIRDTLAVPDPVKLTGDLLATIVLALIGFSLIAGYLSDRIGRKPLHIVAALLVAAGSLLMMFAHDAGAVLIFGSVIGAGIGLFISANWALANDHAPAGEAGKFLGLTNLATAGGGALSRLAGPGIDSLNALKPGAYLGYDGLFIFAAAVALLSLLALRSVPELHHRKETS